MTTILGIRTNTGEDAVVLAADKLLSIYDSQDKYVDKDENVNKVREGRNYVMAYSGSYDEKNLEAFFNYAAGQKDFDSFLRLLSGKRQPHEVDALPYVLFNVSKQLKKKIQDLKTGKVQEPSNIERLMQELITSEERTSDEKKQVVELARFMSLLLKKVSDYRTPVEEAVATRYFSEFALYNRYACMYLLGHEFFENASELILVTRQPTLGLYWVDPTGNVIEPDGRDTKLDWICLGRGSKYAKDYIQEAKYREDPEVKEKIDLDNITTDVALRLAKRAMLKASRDSTTGSKADFYVVTRDRIEQASKSLHDRLHQTDSDETEQMIKRYSRTQPTA